MKKRCFTLVELHVTIVILALLAALFWSSTDALRQRSKQAACVDNLRPLYRSWLSYAADNDGSPPPLQVKINNTGRSYQDNAYWGSIIEAYLPESKNVKPYMPMTLLSHIPILYCPEAPRSKALSSYGVHYGMNYRIFQGPKKNNVKVNDLVKSPKTAIFADSSSFVVGPSWGFQHVRFRHLEGLNLIFGDGHVEWLAQTEVTDKNQFPWRFE
jgi:prepilin-type processing-associated H-X9-DG protein